MNIINVIYPVHIFCLFMIITICANGDWEYEFQFNTYLDDANKVKLYWNVNAPNDTNMIEFGYEVDTSGWLALGIGINSQMTYADIVFSWMSDANIFLQDMHTLHAHIIPYLDNNQSLVLVEGSFINGTTRIRYKKYKQVSCDNLEDYPISPNSTTQFIFAYSSSNIPDINNFYSTVAFHGKTNIGSKRINLHSNKNMFNYTKYNRHDANINYIDFTVNNTKIAYYNELNKNSTNSYYHCKLFNLNALLNDSQVMKVVQMEAIVPEKNKNIVHHMIISRCNFITILIEDMIEFDCDDINFEYIKSDCFSAIGVYTPGSNNIYFPQNTAIDLTDTQYVMVDIHYDFSTYDSRINGDDDYSGMTMFYLNSEYLENNVVNTAGLITVTQNTKKPVYNFIPNNVKNDIYIKHNIYCLSDCTNNYLPASGVKIWSVLMRGHYLMRQINVRIVRNGIELEPILINRNFDFEYQHFQQIYPMRELLPGDEIIVDCYLNSQQRDNITWYGRTSHDEMCLVVLHVIPEPKLFICGSDFGYKPLNEWAKSAANKGFLNGYEYGWEYWHYNTNKRNSLYFYNQLFTNYSKYNSRRSGCIFNVANSGKSHAYVFEETESAIPESKNNFTLYQPELPTNCALYKYSDHETSQQQFIDYNYSHCEWVDPMRNKLNQLKIPHQSKSRVKATLIVSICFITSIAVYIVISLIRSLYYTKQMVVNDEKVIIRKVIAIELELADAIKQKTGKEQNETNEKQAGIMESVHV